MKKFELFIYDHCPYCVIARMIFGIKNQPLKTTILLNDDEKRPRSMIGKKMVPILKKPDGKFMAESLDIVRFIDDKFTPRKVSNKESTALMNILDEAQFDCYALAMPRWVKSGMAEFKTHSARKYFQKKKEQYIGPFAKTLEDTKIYEKKVLKTLAKLEPKIKKASPWYLGEQLSLNDFHLFPFLRSLTIVKGLKFPPLLTQYMKTASKITKIPLNTVEAV